MEEFCLIMKITASVLVVILLVGIFVIGLCMLCEIPERTLFNERFGTSYSATQWLFANSVIKEYIHTGENKTLNINLDE